MTTWHDIADQLTPAQAELLEWLEGDPLNGLLAHPEQHLMFARGWATENLEQSLHADVTPPAAMVELGEWRKSKIGERCRSYRSVIGVGDLDIALEFRGAQFTDGRVECSMALTGSGLAELDPVAARDVAAALLAAADHIEGR